MENLSLVLTATDTSNLSTSETFAATVPAAAPTLAHQTSAQTWLQNTGVAFTLPSNTFSDPNGEALTYSAVMPYWLSLNGTTGKFSGIVPAGIETFSLKVTATDTSNLSVVEVIAIKVPAAAPILANQTTAQSWQPGVASSFSLGANTFTDPNGQNLTYTAAQANGTALPSWLHSPRPTKPSAASRL